MIVISVRILKENIRVFFSECLRVKVNGTDSNDGRVPRLFVARLNRTIMITTSTESISQFIMPRPADSYIEKSSMIFQQTEHPLLVVQYTVKALQQLSSSRYVESCLVCLEVTACESAENYAR